MAAPRLLGVSERIYRLLLRAYPAAFRRAYGPAMVQLFRDCGRDAVRARGGAGLPALWRHTLGDLVRSGLRERLTPAADLAPPERSDPMDRQPRWLRLLPYPLTVLFGLPLGYVNLHTDDTQFVALPLLAVCCLLGFLQPRHAWRWALLTGLWIPLSQLWPLVAPMKLPYTDNNIGGAIIGALLFGMAGAYLGVPARWMVRQITEAADTGR